MMVTGWMHRNIRQSRKRYLLRVADLVLMQFISLFRPYTSQELHLALCQQLLRACVTDGRHLCTERK